jgi:hypothetical protein
MAILAPLIAALVLLAALLPDLADAHGYMMVRGHVHQPMHHVQILQSYGVCLLRCRFH